VRERDDCNEKMFLANNKNKEKDVLLPYLAASEENCLVAVAINIFPLFLPSFSLSLSQQDMWQRRQLNARPTQCEMQRRKLMSRPIV